MKTLALSLLLLCTALAIAGSKPALEISRAGESIIAGPPENIRGKAEIRRFNRPPPERVNGAVVAFAPGAHTAWHTHPLGQTLIITAGCGWVQIEGSPAALVRPGDIVWTPAGAKHWHGATADSAMTHVAIVETLNEKNVEWMEHVPDPHYNALEKRACGN